MSARHFFLINLGSSILYIYINILCTLNTLLNSASARELGQLSPFLSELVAGITRLALYAGEKYHAKNYCKMVIH